MKNQQLIFVYNADSGIWNGTMDVMHKVFSPSTYSCHLCKITYGALSVKSKWAMFIKELNTPTVFYHRDEFQAQYKNNEKLPAIFLLEDEELKVFVASDELIQLNFMELKEMIVGRL